MTLKDLISQIQEMEKIDFIQVDKYYICDDALEKHDWKDCPTIIFKDLSKLEPWMSIKFNLEIDGCKQFAPNVTIWTEKLIYHWISFDGGLEISSLIRNPA